MNIRRRCQALTGIAPLLLAACLQSQPAEEQEPPPRVRNTSPSNSAPPSSTPDSTVPTTAPVPGSNDLSAMVDSEVYAGLLIQQQQVNYGLLGVTKYYCGSPDPINIDAGKGSMTVTFDDVDPPGQSTGDKYEVTFSACQQFNQTIDGSSAFTVDEISGSPYAPAPAVWRIGTTHAGLITTTGTTGTQTLKTNFHFTGGTADGVAYNRHVSGLFESTGSSSGTISSSFENGYGWNVGTNTFTQIISAAFSYSGGSYKFETLKPVTGLLGQTPSDGIVRQTQEFPSLKMITTYTVLTSGTVRIELDADGDGVVDVTYEQPWRNTPLAGTFV